MTYPKYIGLLLIAAFGLTYQPAAVAQVLVQWSLADPNDPNSPTVGDFGVDGNWSGNGGFVPAAQFDEIGEVQDGTTAQVSTDLTQLSLTRPGGLIIDDFSTVDITATGKLKVENGPMPLLVFGVVDLDSKGTLRVAGELTGNSLLNRGGVVRTVGAGSLVTISGDADNLSGTLIAELTSATHSAIRIAGTADLTGGTLEADFNGATAALGSTWDIYDAGAFVGNIDSFAITGASLPFGQGLGVQQVAGGVNGTLLQLLIEQKLFLNFDRETKIASIKNLSGAPVSVSLDGYTISSALGSINPGGWDSLDAQGIEGNTWTESDPNTITMNSISESNSTTFSTIAAGMSLDLGTVYSQNFAGAQFNQELEDHEFIYNIDGRSIEGFVTYSGDKQYNNIVLTVDPNTGEATMQNESEISIEFDAYSIHSPSGSLLTTWNSLADQGASGGEWLEANPDPNRLSEIMTAFNTSTLGLNEGFNLGTLFGGSLTQDLTFQFLKAGVPIVIDGVVIYGDLPTVIDPDGGGFNEADFNMDTFVDGSDVGIWEDNYGMTGATKADGDFDNNGVIDGRDFMGWQRNLGLSAPGVPLVASVPEPASLVLLVAGALGFAVRRRRR